MELSRDYYKYIEIHIKKKKKKKKGRNIHLIRISRLTSLIDQKSKFPTKKTKSVSKVESLGN